MKSYRVILAVVVAMSLTVHAADEFQHATLPYRALCQMAQLDFSDTTGFTNRQVSFKIGSKNPTVELGDIAVFIDSNSGRIPLAISTNGIMTLPISAELARENPNVVANQPKGSMTMEATIAVGGKLRDSLTQNDKGRIRYSGLFISEQIKQGVMRDLTEMQKNYDVASALGKPTIVHLQIKGDAEGSGVTIHARAGNIQLSPTKPGHFVMVCDPKLLKEDPWVQLTPPRKWTMNMTTEEDAEQTPAGDRLKAPPEE